MAPHNVEPDPYNLAQKTGTISAASLNLDFIGLATHYFHMPTHFNTTSDCFFHLLTTEPYVPFGYGQYQTNLDLVGHFGMELSNTISAYNDLGTRRSSLLRLLRDEDDEGPRETLMSTKLPLKP